LLADDGYQDINAHGDPYLRLDRVIGGAKKMFDAQVLFDPFEEQLDPPAAFIELGNGLGGQVKVIGQKHQRLAALRVFVTDAAESVGVMRRALPGAQPHDVVTADAGAFIHGQRLQPVEPHAGFRARDKERSRQHEAVEPLKIHIAPVNHVEGSRLENQFVQHAHIGLFAVGNGDHRRDGSAQIQQRVQFDRGLGNTKARPGKQTQTKIDGGGIQRVNRLLQFHAQRFAGVQTACARDEPLRQRGIDAPVAFAVGVGQRAVSDGGAKPQPIELVVPGAQADLDVGQAIPISELGKGHGQKLIPAGEVMDSMVAVIALNTATKLFGVNPVRELRKNCLSSVHSSSLAWPVLRKMPKRSSNRSHHFSCICCSLPTPLKESHPS